MASRYDNLKIALATVLHQGTKHLRFLEVGTYDGIRATDLLKTWLSYGPTYSAEYHGFDMFELLTPDMSKAELSKSKLPPSEEEVLASMRKHFNTRTKIQLHKGNTRETLAFAAKVLPEMNLIYVDGGHSLETIASDWENVRQLMMHGTQVLFDDYYENRTDYGCKTLIDELKARKVYKVDLLDPVDKIEQNGLEIRMAKVTL